MTAPLVVGFDLDLTLIDTRPGRAVGPHLVLAGAHEALASVREHQGQTLVVTGRYRPNAQLQLDALGFDVDHLVDRPRGPGKVELLNACGVTVLVGTHVHHVEGALAAGAVSVSVLTGGCTEEQLREAGTDVVLRDLTEFPAWLDEHVLQMRLSALAQDLRARGSLMVAFSGGADSAFLLAAATRVLGPERVVAATAYSDSLPLSERGTARAFAEELGVRVLTPQTHEIEREGYVRNDGDRCFHCKAELLDVLTRLAPEHDVAWVATGTNADDARAGFRPGIRAAGERGAVTPLLDAGLTKEQIREASRRWGLPTWDKPAAACLSSRVAYGIQVSRERLARIERAEAAVRGVLADTGVAVGNLRVRDLGRSASIELDADVLAVDPDGAVEAVLAAGFEKAHLDPRGFRSGSMNERLTDPERFR